MKSEKLEIYLILYEIFDYRLAQAWRKAKRFMKYGRKKGKDARGSAPSTCHRAEANGDGQTFSPESGDVIPGEETKHSDHRASSGRNRSAEEEERSLTLEQIAFEILRRAAVAWYQAQTNRMTMTATQWTNKQDEVMAAAWNYGRLYRERPDRNSDGERSELRPDDTKHSGSVR